VDDGRARMDVGQNEVWMMEARRDRGRTAQDDRMKLEEMI